MSYNPDFESIHLQNNYKIALVSTLWNKEMTGKMLRDAESTLKENKNIQTKSFQVAGCIELGHAAALLQEKYDGVIILGVVIRGETSHFDYVCQSITSVTSMLLAKAKAPVIFGVLTVDNKVQALDRIEGPKERKGKDCAESLVQQLYFMENIS